MITRHGSTITTCLLALFCMTVAPMFVGPASAYVYWQVGTGNWSTGTNWHGGEPDLGENARINNGGTAQITSGNTEYARDLFLGYGDTDTGNVSMAGGVLNTDDAYVGRYGTGTFQQSGGTHHVAAYGSVDHLYIGYATSSHAGNGTYRLSSTGQLSIDHNSGDIYVGRESGSYGTGRFEWFRSGGITVGSGGNGKMVVGSLGTLAMGYNFNAYYLMNGTLVPLTGLNLATLEVTNGATATQSFLGTTSGVKYLRIGSGTGNGTGVLSAGTMWTTSDETIGDAGTGVMNHSGGINDVDGHLYVGRNFGSGTYNLSGSGSLLDVGSHFHVGYNSTGIFTQTGGTNTFSGSNLYVGQGTTGDGTYRLSAGTITGGTISVAQDAGSTGRFEWFRPGGGGLSVTSMTLHSNGTLAMGYDFNVSTLASSGYVTLSGLNAATLEVTNGVTATHNSGAATVGNLRVGSATGDGIYGLTSTGQLTVNTGGSARVGADSGNGRFEWFRTGGFTTPDLTLGSSATLAMGADFNVNQLVGGTLFGGTLNGLNLATLEITNAATATHGLGSATVKTLQLGSTAGAGTYTLSNTGSLATPSGGSVRVGADSGDGRFEWFRSGGLTIPGGTMTLGSAGTLAMGHDFNVDDLVTGSLYGGSAPTGLDQATLEITNGGTATHTSGSANVNTLQLGSSDGGGTYNLSGTGEITISSGGSIRIGADSGTGKIEWHGGTISSPAMTFGSAGTLEMGFDFNVNSLIAGSLYGGSPPSGLDQATLAVTDATATHDTGSATIGTLRVGEGPGTAHYNLSGGSLSASTQEIGAAHSGTFTHSGGTNTVDGVLALGSQAGTAGSYTLENGTLTGTGHLIVRGDDAASGTFTGYGTAGLTGILFNSGRVVADGDDVSRTLDMSSLNSVVNVFENPAGGGTNGWTAVHKGKLTLPAVHVDTGDKTYNWGESPHPDQGGMITDKFIDLVNSVQMAFEGVTQDGELTISLLAENHGDVPPLPPLSKIIGVWNFSPKPNLNFDNVDLTFRYDDAEAATQGISETSLGVYHYDGVQWEDVFTNINTTGKWIFANDIKSFSYFAVGIMAGTAIPEPATLLLLVLASVGFMLLRRRN